MNTNNKTQATEPGLIANDSPEMTIVDMPMMTIVDMPMMTMPTVGQIATVLGNKLDEKVIAPVQLTAEEIAMNVRAAGNAMSQDGRGRGVAAGAAKLGAGVVVVAAMTGCDKTIIGPNFGGEQVDTRSEVQKYSPQERVTLKGIKLNQTFPQGEFISTVVVSPDGKNYLLKGDFKLAKEYFINLANSVELKSGIPKEKMIAYIGVDGKSGDGSTGQYFQINMNDLINLNSNTLLSSFPLFQEDNGDLTKIAYTPGASITLDCSVYVIDNIIDSKRNNPGFDYKNFYSKELRKFTIGL